MHDEERGYYLLVQKIDEDEYRIEDRTHLSPDESGLDNYVEISDAVRIEDPSERETLGHWHRADPERNDLIEAMYLSGSGEEKGWEFIRERLDLDS